jgi:hypothetical protein
MMKFKTSIDVEGATFSAPKDDSIKALNFWYNTKIKFLPVRVAETFPSLTAYMAAGCSLKKISKENFRNMDRLKLLWLQNNQITIINGNTFEDLHELEQLWLC